MPNPITPSANRKVNHEVAINLLNELFHAYSKIGQSPGVFLALKAYNRR